MLQLLARKMTIPRRREPKTGVSENHSIQRPQHHHSPWPQGPYTAPVGDPLQAVRVQQLTTLYYNSFMTKSHGTKGKQIQQEAKPIKAGTQAPNPLHKISI